MKYLKRKLQDEIQDMKDVEVDMKDYLDIMSDVKEVEAKRQRMSDGDVELNEESYLRIMSEDYYIKLQMRILTLKTKLTIEIQLQKVGWMELQL